MQPKPKYTKISKFLSRVLRHKPQKIGLSLDNKGWANLDELITQSNKAGVQLNKKIVALVVEQNDKKRFTISDDGQRIRANQGHSIPVDLELEPINPPEFLFHGTALHFVDSIKDKGLISRKRNHVHLSPDEETATKVGRRHGEPCVLTIQAGKMFEAGFLFYQSVNGVWLIKEVPAEYIIFSKFETNVQED